MNGAVIGCFCAAAVLLIIGIVLCTGHGSWLLAGYNTMKKEEREKYDEKKLCRGAGILMLIQSALCIAMGLTEAFCPEEIIDIVAKICAALILITITAWIILGNIFCKK